MNLKEQMDIGVKAKIYAEQLGEGSLVAEHPKDGVSLVPTTWINGLGQRVGFEALGLAMFLIGFKRVVGDVHVHWQTVLSFNKGATKKSLIRNLQKLSKENITHEEENGDWLFRALQPEGEMLVRVLMS